MTPLHVVARECVWLWCRSKSRCHGYVGNSKSYKRQRQCFLSEIRPLPVLMMYSFAATIAFVLSTVWHTFTLAVGAVQVILLTPFAVQQRALEALVPISRLSSQLTPSCVEGNQL